MLKKLLVALALCLCSASGQSTLGDNDLCPVEEGWRWRSNVRVLVEGTKLDFTPIHTSLNNFVQTAINRLKELKSTQNVCMGGVSIVYKSPEEPAQYVYTSLDESDSCWRYTPDTQPTPPNWGFASGETCSGRDLFAFEIIMDKVMSSLPQNPVSPCYDKYSLFWRTLGVFDKTPPYAYIGPYTYKPKSIVDKIKKWDSQRTSTSQSKGAQKDIFKDTWCATPIDSEQSMLIYAKCFLEKILKDPLKKIPSSADIKGVIFHVSTQRDMCSLCATTLFRESKIFHDEQIRYDRSSCLEGHIAQSHLWDSIRKGLGGAMPANMRLLFMVSSNVTYSRDFSVKLSRHIWSSVDAQSFPEGWRRSHHVSSHAPSDGAASGVVLDDSGHSIVDLATYPPYGVQIAEHRDAVTRPPSFQLLDSWPYVPQSTP